jgi:single-stranded DNA-binding protein
VVLDGVVKGLALRYAADGKPELRFTLEQTEHAIDGKPWTSYWPCCALGPTAERLASELDEGQRILVSSGKLCYRKRTTKLGEQSRMEVLVWTVERLTEVTQDEREPTSETASERDTSPESVMAPMRVNSARRQPWP